MHPQKQPAPPLRKAPETPLPAKRERLSPKEEFEKIRALYKDKSNQKANFLIIGAHGSGKTYGMRNAPGPVLIHSFDQGGSASIEREEINSGRILIDTRFEDDSAHNPRAFRAWEMEFIRLRNSEFFEAVGTYVIDSWTSFSQSLMNEILKARGRRPPQRADLGKDPDIVPEMGDYNVHQKTLAQVVADITSLPCHVVVLAHLNVDKDETSGRTNAMVMMDGKKFAQMLPTMFDEVYFADSKGPPNALRYIYRLVPMGYFPARSRLRRGGQVLGAEEEQDLKAILKRTGYPYEDKPLFNS